VGDKETGTKPARNRCCCAIAFGLLCLALSFGSGSPPIAIGGLGAAQQQKLDPAAWGSDHVGQPVPEYLTGDECLFCHRTGIGGNAWTGNRHNLTIHELEPEDPALKALQKKFGMSVASEAKMMLGGRRLGCFLKRSDAYGKLDMLSTQWQPPAAGKDGALVGAHEATWDAKKFGDSCAGCHATAVDSKTRAFSSPALDCYVCHGAVDPKHSKDTSLVHLSKKRNDPARVTISICAQCHVRTGQARSTGLPYPDNFIAGDNLFRNLAVDFSAQALERLNPADRHVMANVRDVVLLGQDEVTCLSCHEVHKQSTLKHRRLIKTDLCLNCHEATGSMKVRKSYEVHSKTCGY
jgi:hypothetical protein